LLFVNEEVGVRRDEATAAEAAVGDALSSCRAGSARRSAAVAAAVAVAYLLLAQCIDWLNDPLRNGAAFWPAAGVTVAALLVVPTRHWWMVLSAVLACESGVNLAHGLAPGPAVVWGVANALEPLVGAALVRRVLSRSSLTSVRQLLLFLAFAAGVAPAVAAAVGAVAAVPTLGVPWVETWVRWTVGDALGVLVMAPPLLAWHERGRVPRSLAERSAVTVAVAAGAALVLHDGGPTWGALLPYLTLPALVWAATRFGMRGATLAGLLTAHVANLALALGQGPFAGTSGTDATTALQLSLGITVGTGLVLAALAADLSGRDEVERVLGHQAAHDHLTGLPNRVLLHERLAQVLDRAEPGRAVGVLFLDLDRFKAVNDSLGHAWGDALLVQTAERLQAAGRPRDLVARLGGDEFVVVCPDLDDPAEAGAVARRMLAAVSEPVHHDGRTVAVSTSIGIATVTAPGRTPEEVLRNADTAMYRAKTDGRSRIDFFDEGLHAQAQDRLQLELELRLALASGELRLHYQPVLSAGDLRQVAVEALLRWAHPVRGVLAPREFLAVAEDAGLLGPVGDWVVVQALHDLAACGDPDLAVSLNVSALQLREAAGSDVAALVLTTCQALGLDPRRVVLELSEVAALEAGGGQAALTRLRDAGVRLALDDFGAGSTSLAQLADLPLDLVKVDPSFVAGATRSQGGTRRLAALVALVHTYELMVVAEGVEDEAQLAAVRACGVDLLQGYHLGAPVPWAPAVLPPRLAEPAVEVDVTAVTVELRA
jgi:diguanylate cyclase (GGDEF)-like protein